MNSNKKLWLLKETILPTIDITHIADHCIIWLENNNILVFQLPKLYINLVINGKIHNINLRHQHPIEYLQQLQDP